LGAIASGALGSGIGTLVQGGNLKDAFKAALIGGAMGGISSGIGSVMKGGEFMAGVKSGLPTGLGGGVNASIAPTALTAAEQAKVAALESSGRITDGTAAVDLTGAEALGPEIMPPQAGADAVIAATKEGMQAAGGVPTNLDMTPPVGGGPTNLNMTGPTNLNMSPIPGAKSAQLAQQAKTAAGGVPTNLDMSPVPGAKEAFAKIDAATTGATETATTGATETATTGATSAAQDALITSAKAPTSFFDKIRQGDFIDAFKGQTRGNKRSNNGRVAF
jgi:hypothetical protein